MSPPSLSLHSTLEDRAQRLFSTKTVPLERLDPSLFAKSKDQRAKDPEKQKETAFLEAQVYRYTEILGVGIPPVYLVYFWISLDTLGYFCILLCILGVHTRMYPWILFRILAYLDTLGYSWIFFLHVPVDTIAYTLGYICHPQEQKAATCENVERRMARTAEELLEEEEVEEEEEEEEESGDEETVPYNPKNLPLGWDGKV